jgi:hypothetical protein
MMSFSLGFFVGCGVASFIGAYAARRCARQATRACDVAATVSDDLSSVVTLRRMREGPEGDGKWIADKDEGRHPDTGEPTILRRHDVALFGQDLHIYAVRVNDDDEPQEAVHDPCHRLDSLYQMDEPGEPFQSIEIDGFPGRWVLVISPYCD